MEMKKENKKNMLAPFSLLQISLPTSALYF